MPSHPARAGEPGDLWVLNARVRVLKSWREPGDVSVLQHRYPARDGVPLHVHDDEDMLFRVLEGRVLFLLGEEERWLAPGQAVITPRGVAHAFTIVSEDGATVLTASTGVHLEQALKAVGRPAQGEGLPLARPLVGERLARFDAALREEKILLAAVG